MGKFNPHISLDCGYHLQTNKHTVSYLWSFKLGGGIEAELLQLSQNIWWVGQLCPASVHLKRGGFLRWESDMARHEGRGSQSKPVLPSVRLPQPGTAGLSACGVLARLPSSLSCPRLDCRFCRWLLMSPAALFVILNEPDSVLLGSS